MNLTEIIGRMLGLKQTQAIEDFELSLGASWANDAPAWLFFGCLGLSVLVVLFYARYQRQRHVAARVVMAVFRGAALCLLLLALAKPILTVNVTSQKKPSLWFLFDGTDSMAMVDELSINQRDELAEAVGLDSDRATAETPGDVVTRRVDYLKALLQNGKGTFLDTLAEKCRLRAFLFERGDGARSLELSADGREAIDGDHLAAQLTTDGDVSAIGAALDDLARHHSTTDLAGLVIFSDFNQNAGPAALASAKALGVQIQTVGLGATTAVDVSVGIQAPLHVKKDERATVEVTVRQFGLDGEQVKVKLAAERLGGLDADAAETTVVGEQTVLLAGPV